jgi:hypothetical protein
MALAKILVLRVVTSNGKKCPIVFMPDGQKVTADPCQVLLFQHVMPWLSSTYPEENYMFQQEGAPMHTANSTHRFVEINIAAQGT